jgi:hypothetical protein
MTGTSSATRRAPFGFKLADLKRAAYLDPHSYRSVRKVPVKSNNNSPTYPPPPKRGLAPVLDRNIEALQQRRKREEQGASWQERVADAITRLSGSMLFVYIP